MMNLMQVMNLLKEEVDKDYVKVMKRYGIEGNVLGVRIPVLRELAEEVGKNHGLARELWKKGYRETRILASMIEEVSEVSAAQMNEWVEEFKNWELCDEVIMNCFEKTRFAWSKISEWCDRDEEFVKRAGFVLIARLAVSDKEASDEEFLQFNHLIKKHASDDRNYVRKAVNWAIRQVGKRNECLNKEMIKLCEELRREENKNSNWIALNALKELKSRKVKKRFKKRGS